MQHTQHIDCDRIQSDIEAVGLSRIDFVHVQRSTAVVDLDRNDHIRIVVENLRHQRKLAVHTHCALADHVVRHSNIRFGRTDLIVAAGCCPLLVPVLILHLANHRYLLDLVVQKGLMMICLRTNCSVYADLHFHYFWIDLYG